MELLFRAHLSGEACGLGIHGPRFWASLVVKGRKVHHAEGVPGLLGPLEAELPDPSQLRGQLSHDVGVAMNAGFPLDRILDSASMGLGLFLASLVDRDDVHAHLQPNRLPPPGSFPLSDTVLRLFARGLRELRSPAMISSQLNPYWDTPLRLSDIPPEQVPDLEPIAVRTVHLIRPRMTLGELVVVSGRHQQERTAWAWRSLDLLLQLGLVELEHAVPESRASELRFPDERPAERISVSESPPQPVRIQAPAAPPPPAQAPAAQAPTPPPEPPVVSFAQQAPAPEPPSLSEFTGSTAAASLPSTRSATAPNLERYTPLDKEVMELVTRCAELNPLVVLDLKGPQLHDVVTLQGIQAAFQREATRYRPEVFTQGSMNTMEAVSALDEIFRSSREALRDPAIVALWLRELRAFAEQPVEANEEDSERGRVLFERAQAHVMRREWRDAQHLVEQALRLDPRQVRARILDIFCRVALRLISPTDGVLNLDALWLSDPKDHALALVTAGRLLKAAGKRSQALARYRAALELDPDRADARREVESLEQGA